MKSNSILYGLKAAGGTDAALKLMFRLLDNIFGICYSVGLLTFLNNRAVFERCPANNVASFKLLVLLHIRNNNSKGKLTAVNANKTCEEKTSQRKYRWSLLGRVKVFFKKIASLK